MLRQALDAAIRLLRESQVDSPRLSAEVLLAESLGITRESLLKRLILQPHSVLTPEARQRFMSLTLRRATGEPVAYLTGRREFYGREFRVSQDTLIPRPETELIIDRALALFSSHDQQTPSAPGSGSASEPGRASTSLLFADFGTGSGCIAVTLGLERPQWTGLALDRSLAALRVARSNAAKLKAHNLTFLQADFTTPPFALSCLDLIVSNPPYVSSADYHALSREVRAFEPMTALVPQAFGDSHAHKDSSGVEDAETIIARAEALLKPGGMLLMEIGCDQACRVLPLLASPAWGPARVHKDLAGLDRLVEAMYASG